MAEENKLKDKLLKLLALSERGIGGEAANAEAMLHKLLKDHDMDMSDITDPSDELTYIFVNYKTRYEKKLFTQICYKVFNSNDFDTYKKTNQSGKIGTEATPAQCAEIATLYSIYRKAFKKECDVFYNAFLQKNRIFPENSANPNYIPTEDDLRAAQMADSLNRVNIHKQIEQNND